MIVNGDKEFIGSKVNSINRTINSADDIAAIDLEITDAAIKVSIPDFPVNTSSSKIFWLYGIKSKHTQDIPSGENAGRTVTYVNAVMEQIEYSRTGSLREFTMENPNWDDIDELVLLAQDNRYGKIIAAGKVTL